MGQAKLRGTFADRRAAALEQQEREERERAAAQRERDEIERARRCEIDEREAEMKARARAAGANDEFVLTGSSAHRHMQRSNVAAFAGLIAGSMPGMVDVLDAMPSINRSVDQAAFVDSHRRSRGGY